MGGATYAYTFDKTGSYDYFCMVHPWMVGNIKVN
jgi:plastocyanin